MDKPNQEITSRSLTLQRDPPQVNQRTAGSPSSCERFGSEQSLPRLDPPEDTVQGRLYVPPLGVRTVCPFTTLIRPIQAEGSLTIRAGLHQHHFIFIHYCSLSLFYQLFSGVAFRVILVNSINCYLELTGRKCCVPGNADDITSSATIFMLCKQTITSHIL